MLFTIITFTPVSIWFSLSVGSGISAQQYAYSILLLAIEIAYLSHNPLTMQEVATVFVGLSSINAGIGIELIRSAYLSQSDVLAYFGLKGKIPFWVAPLPESGFYASRSFFHPQALEQWFGLLGWVGMLIPSLSLFAGLSLGILNKVLYVDEEKLEYPGVQVQAEFCITLTSRETRRLSFFSIFFLLSFVYSILVYVFPVVPVLWVDLSREIQKFLPGACFGFATDLITFTPAFYLPFYVIACQLIGSIAIWVFGNSFIVNLGLTKFSELYYPGMNMRDIALYANLYVWMLPLLGLGIFAGFSNLRPSIARRVYASLKRAGRADAVGIERFFSIWLVIIPMAVAIISNLLEIWYWAPDYPFWPWFPAVYSLLLSLPTSLLAGRAAGTGIEISIPEGLDRIVLVAANYKGINAWFVGPTIFSPTFFGGPLDVNFKLSQLTKSTFTSFIKMMVVTYPISTLVALVFTQIFWSWAQIPSASYPFSAYSWPREVMEMAAWITRPKGAFHLEWIIYGAIAGLAIYVPSAFFFGGSTATTALTSLIAGAGMLPPFAVNLLVGYIIRRILEHYLGAEEFNKYKFTIVAGIATGSGVSVAIGIGSTLIGRSIWMLPY